MPVANSVATTPEQQRAPAARRRGLTYTHRSTPSAAGSQSAAILSGTLASPAVSTRTPARPVLGSASSSTPVSASTQDLPREEAQPTAAVVAVPLGTPSPKRKKMTVESHYYQVVEKIFAEFSITEEQDAAEAAPQRLTTQSVSLLTEAISDEAPAAPADDASAPGPVRHVVVPTASLRRATSQLRLNIRDADVTEAVAASSTGDGLTRDEFVAFVHQHLRLRTTAEEVIYNMVQLNINGDVPSDELRQMLLSESLLDAIGSSEPLSDDEYSALLDRVDPRNTKIIHVGVLVRVLCPDESEEVIEMLLEKYGVGKSRRQQQRQTIEDEEQCERELHQSIEGQSREDLAYSENQRRRAVQADADRRAAAEEEARQKAERERRQRELDEERRRLEAERVEKLRRDAAAKAAAEAAERDRLAAEEAERRRREKELLRIQQEKAKAGCCRIDYSKK